MPSTFGHSRIKSKKLLIKNHSIIGLNNLPIHTFSKNLIQIRDKNPSNLENKLFNINEDYKNFTIKTEILRIENDQLNSNLVSTKMEVNNLSSMLEIEKENSRNIMAKLNN